MAVSRLAFPACRSRTKKHRVLPPLQWLKKPAVDGPPAQRDPKVVERVSQMLREIERKGMDAVRAYAEELDGWSGDLEIGEAGLKKSGDALPPDVRTALEMGYERTHRFAAAQRGHLTDFEIELAPGVNCGQRYVPVSRVGRICRRAGSRCWPARS